MRPGVFSNLLDPTLIRFTRHTYWFWFSAFVRARFSAWRGRPSILSRVLWYPIISSKESGDLSSTVKRKPRPPIPGCPCQTLSAALIIRRTQQDGERESAGEIWQQTKDMPSLIYTGRYGTPVDPRTLNRKFTARCEVAGVRPITVHDARHTCATLLVDLDVHPRVIMRVLRHADQAVTMEIYANASSAATQEALRPLGETLH